MNPSQRNPAGTSIDPKALIALGDIEWRARVVLEGFRHGLHRSPVRGFSAEFTEYRPYVPGDDTRRLDWKLAARTDRWHMKQFEEETNTAAYLLVDQSRSMQYGSLGYSKQQYGNTFAATLAQFFHDQGDAIGLLTFSDSPLSFTPARRRRGHLRTLFRQLDTPAEGRLTALHAPINRLYQLVRRRSLILILSDFLAPLDDFAAELKRIGAAGHQLILVRLLDPAEINLPFDKTILLEDLETGRPLFVNAPTSRSSYLEAMGNHFGILKKLCDQHGFSWCEASTSEPFDGLLRKCLEGARGHGVRGRRATGQSTGRR